jgi:hypothetical protein
VNIEIDAERLIQWQASLSSKLVAMLELVAVDPKPLLLIESGKRLQNSHNYSLSSAIFELLQLCQQPVIFLARGVNNIESRLRRGLVRPVVVEFHYRKFRRHHRKDELKDFNLTLTSSFQAGREDLRGLPAFMTPPDEVLAFVEIVDGV